MTMDYLLMFLGLALAAFSVMLIGYGFFGGKPLLQIILVNFLGWFLLGGSIMIGLLGLAVHDTGWSYLYQKVLFYVPIIPICIFGGFLYAINVYMRGSYLRDAYYNKRTPEWVKWWISNWDVPDLDWSGLRKLIYRFRVWRRRRDLKRR
jgi:hypothetical protein